MIRLMYFLLGNGHRAMALEYALMVCLVCIALITGGSLMGRSVDDTYNTLSAKAEPGAPQ